MHVNKNLLSNIAIILIVPSVLLQFIFLLAPSIWNLNSWRMLDVLRIFSNLVVATAFIIFIVAMLKFRGGKNRKKLTPLAVSFIAIVVVPLGFITYALIVSTFRITLDLVNGTDKYFGKCSVYKVIEKRNSSLSKTYTYRLEIDDSIFADDTIFEISPKTYEAMSNEKTSAYPPVFSMSNVTPNIPCISDVKIEYTQNSKHVLNIKKI